MLTSIGANAQTSSEQELVFAKHKYMVAKTMYEVGKKCNASTTRPINGVTMAVSELSAKDYGDILQSKGQSTYVTETNTGLSAALSSTPCSAIHNTPNWSVYVQDSSHLINEVLYALHLSNASECGKATNLMKPVMEEATRISPGLKARPDFNAFTPLAETRAEKLKEMCDGDNIFDGDIIFMSQKPLGKIVIEMGKVTSGQ